jgi:plasmid stability protein
MNLTVTVDDEVLRRARIRALEQGTSVNAIVREFLDSFAGAEEEREARSRLAELARASPASSGEAGRDWAREDLYSERLERPRRQAGSR